VICDEPDETEAGNSARELNLLQLELKIFSRLPLKYSLGVLIHHFAALLLSPKSNDNNNKRSDSYQLVRYINFL
jgi:hypothetical protein